MPWFVFSMWAADLLSLHSYYFKCWRWPHTWLLSYFFGTVGTIWSPSPSDSKNKVTAVGQSTTHEGTVMSYFMWFTSPHDSHLYCCIHNCVTHNTASMGQLEISVCKITLLHKPSTVRQTLLRTAISSDCKGTQDWSYLTSKEDFNIFC